MYKYLILITKREIIKKEQILLHEKRKRKVGNGQKMEIGEKGARGTTGTPRSSLFHSFQSLICVRSSANEASAEDRGANLYTTETSKDKNPMLFVFQTISLLKMKCYVH